MNTNQFIRKVSTGLMLSTVLVILSSFSATTKIDVSTVKRNVTFDRLYSSFAPAQINKRNYIYTTNMVNISVGRNSWGGTIIGITLSGGPEGTIGPLYATNSTGSWSVPEGYYWHAYIQYADHVGDAYAALRSFGDGQYCSELPYQGEGYVDIPGVIVDVTQNEFIVGDYCNYY